MGRYFKYNPETDQYDIPCSWKENVIYTSENTWLPKWRREEVKKLVEDMSESEAEQLCNELEKEIEWAINEWRNMQ